MSRTTVNFGQTSLYTPTSQTVTATIDAGYTGGDITPTGAYALSADTCNGFVGPGTCSMTFTFTPTEVGTPTESISFSEHNGSVFQSLNIVLTGNAVSTLHAIPSAVNFGQVPLNTTVSRTITVIPDINFTPLVDGSSSGNQPPFAMTNDTCPVVSGPTTCTLTETFTPTAIGSASAGLQVAEFDAAQSGVGPFTIYFTGTGVTTLPAVVTGSQTYGSTNPTFGAVSTPPPGDSFGGTLQCTSVGSPSQTISPSLTAGMYTINGSSCSGLTLSGPTAADYAITYSGSTFTVNKAPTTLVAAPVSILASLLSLKATFSATLVESGTIKAIPGQSVNFSDGPLDNCTGTTNVNGVASCSVSIVGVFAFLLSPSYSASYSGGIDYQPSSATGTVTLP